MAINSAGQFCYGPTPFDRKLPRKIFLKSTNDLVPLVPDSGITPCPKFRCNWKCRIGYKCKCGGIACRVERHSIST